MLLQQPNTCGDVKPVSSPGERYTCPKLYEYDEAKEDSAKPSPDTCCRVSNAAAAVAVVTIAAAMAFWTQKAATAAAVAAA
jgi:hypothetical protein